MIEVPLNAIVECADGPAGRSTYVLIDPKIRRITNLVVREKNSPHIERIVPMDWIAETTPDVIRLHCTKDELAGRMSFIETEVLRVKRPQYGCRAWPNQWSETETITVKHRRIPPGELAIHKNAEIRATDGRVGRLNEFVIDLKSGQLSHLIFEKGHFWGRRQATLPVSQIDHAFNNRIYLKLSKQELHPFDSRH